MAMSPLSLFQRSAHAAGKRAAFRTVTRSLSSSSSLRATKHHQNKEDIVVESQEYSKSGSDHAAADIGETAFGKDKTGVEEQRNKAEVESREVGQESNPLDVSPANREASKARDPAEEQDGSNVKPPSGASKMTGAAKHTPVRRYQKQ